MGQVQVGHKLDPARPMDNPSLIDYLTYKAMMWHFLGVMGNVFNIKKVYIIIDTSETHDPWKKKQTHFIQILPKSKPYQSNL